LSKFGCRGNSREILDIILEFVSPTNLTVNFFHRTEISAVLAYFCLNLVAMATPLAHLKIDVAYLNLPTLYAILHYTCENVLMFCTELKFVLFWLIFAQIWLPWQLH